MSRVLRPGTLLGVQTGGRQDFLSLERLEHRMMLDRQRLYGNRRPFRSGPWKDVCPYRALGLQLPTDGLRELLYNGPARLTQRLSVQGNVV